MKGGGGKLTSQPTGLVSQAQPQPGLGYECVRECLSLWPLRRSTCQHKKSIGFCQTINITKTKSKGVFKAHTQKVPVPSFLEMP